jgi:hypothetical protein
MPTKKKIGLSPSKPPTPIEAGEEDELRSYFKPKPVKLGLGPDQLPDVPPAPQFRKNAFPLVIGRPGEARLVEKLLNIIPEARGSTPSILFGPGEGASDFLADSGFGPEDFEKTNLLGTTHNKTRAININPRLRHEDPSFMLETLTHELKHAHDRPPHKQAYEAGYKYPKRLLKDVNTTPKRTIIDELSEALNKQGVKFKVGRE